MRRRDEQVTAVTSNHSEGGNTLAGREAGDAIAKSVNVADNVVPGSEGKRLFNGIEAVAHEDVNISNAGGNDLDAHLTRTGHWQVVFDPLESFRPATSDDDHPPVFHGSHRPTVAQGHRVRQREAMLEGQGGARPRANIRLKSQVAPFSYPLRKIGMRQDLQAN